LRAGRAAARKALDELAQDDRRPGDVAAGGPLLDLLGLLGVEVAGVLVDLGPGAQAGHVQFGVELGGVDVRADPEGLHRAAGRTGQQNSVAGKAADRLFMPGEGVEGGRQPAQQRVALALGREGDPDASDRFGEAPVDDRALMAADRADAVAGA
jgi:hypothetical protein